MPTVTNSPTPPSAPAEGDLWFDTTTGRQYDWYISPGTGLGSWVQSQPTGGAVVPTAVAPTTAPSIPSISPHDVTRVPTITMSAVPPTAPVPGDLWWNTISGKEFIFYDDGNTQQWVISNRPSFAPFDEAPIDGKQYARQNANWTESLPIVGGKVTGEIDFLEPGGLMRSPGPYPNGSWQWFDMTNPLVNVKHGLIFDIVTTNSSSEINTNGIILNIYTPPDNGGDVSGMWIRQSGGGNGLSVYNLYEDRPAGLAAYPNQGFAIEARVSGGKHSIYSEAVSGAAFLAVIGSTDVTGSGLIVKPRATGDMNRRAVQVLNAAGDAESFYANLAGDLLANSSLFTGQMMIATATPQIAFVDVPSGLKKYLRSHDGLLEVLPDNYGPAIWTLDNLGETFQSGIAQALTPPPTAFANELVTAAWVLGKAYAPISSLPSTLPPSGPAGGALTGTYPNPTLVGGPLSNYQTIAGMPTSLPPSGPAGGALQGTYPNPTLVGGPLSNYATTAALAGYLPLTGGVLSGQLWLQMASPLLRFFDTTSGKSKWLRAHDDYFEILRNDFGLAVWTLSELGQTFQAGIAMASTPAPAALGNELVTAEWVLAKGYGTGGGGGGAPTGPAGGVLSGTYPNPGFAPSPVFTGNVDIVAGSFPAIHYTDTSGAVGRKNWATYVFGGDFYLELDSDDWSTTLAYFWFRANGNIELAANPAPTAVGQELVTAGWVLAKGYSTGGGGGAPTGPAGGALAGTYPNPTLVGGPLSNYQTIAGMPTSLPPSGAAGGALSGTYPNPGLSWISRTAAQTLAIGTGGTLGSNAFTSTAYQPAGSYQTADATLTALAGIAATGGVIEQTSGDVFGIRLIGVANATDLLTRAGGDGRYQPTGSYQPLEPTLTALAGIVATAGLVEQTSGDVFGIRLIGVGAGSSIPTTALADARYAAISHTHTASQITDFAEALDDRVAALLIAGTNITLTYNDVANTLRIDSGAVVGVAPPGSPTDGQMWFDSDAAAGGGQLYIYYNDGTSSAWVPATPSSTGSLPTGPAGGDLLGTYPNPTLNPAVIAVIPQNSQSATYPLVLADAGRHIYHPVAAAAAIYTIPANASVPYPIGTTLTFVNDSANVVTVSITSDVLVWSPGTTTGSRSLAVGGMATALKVTATRWLISGTGLS